MFLEDYFGPTALVPASVQARVLERVQTEAGTTMAALLAAEPGVRANDLYVMMAREQLYTELSAVPLVEHWRVQLYPDQQTYKAHTNLALGLTRRVGNRTLGLPSQLETNTKLIWDGQLWTLVNLGETATALLPKVGQPIELPTDFFLQLLLSGTISHSKVESEPSVTLEVRRLMDAASPTDLREANRRYKLVQAYVQHQADLEPDIAKRTLQRWVRQFREAEANYGCGYVGLLPRTAQCGNRTSKAPQELGELLDSFIADRVLNECGSRNA